MATSQEKQSRVHAHIRLIVLLMTISILVFGTGCGLLVSTSSSSEVVSFIKGELNSRINHKLEDVWKASQKVAEESEFQIKSNRADAFSAVLKCEDAQQRKIDITLEKEEESITRVKIRVGLLGDAEFSTKIFDQISAKANK